MTLKTLTGRVTRVVHEDPAGRFAVFELLGPDGLAIVTGQARGIAVGTQVRATGDFHTHARFGRRFRATTVLVLPPEELEGIEAWLGSGKVRGVGEKMARRIARHFGAGLRDALEAGPDRLVECPGIGRSRAEAIQEAWTRQVADRETFLLLSGMGLTRSQVERVMRVHGAEGPARVSQDPFGLIRTVPGIGFRTADAIASRQGMAPDSPERLKAASIFVLETAAEAGHLFLPVDGVVSGVCSLTGQDARAVELAIAGLVADGRVVPEVDGSHPVLYLSSLFHVETHVARRIWDLLDQAVPNVRTRDLPQWLAPSQAFALSALTSAPLSVLTGGPGTGKTSLVSVLLDIAAQAGLKVVLAAPTGRAAMRLKETTGQEGRTLHRLLDFNPRTGRFQRDETSPLDADWVVVDEASMLDIVLADHLLAAVAPGTRVTFVGDADQLPPVGPGDPFRDLIASGVVPVARLTEVFRQGAGSGITAAAHRILSGHEPDRPAQGAGLSDFYLVEREDPAGVAEAVERLVAERIPARFGLDPVRQIQVLAPMRRGECGTDALNARLRARLNPRAEGRRFAVGDRVICNRNNYDREVFNGDIGVVVAMVKDGALRVQFEEREVLLEPDELDDLSLAHAITVHKAQGSEFPAVVAALHAQHYVMLRRNLLYTAVTRGRRLVVLVGSRKAIRIAVDNARVEPRNTRLAWRLRAEARGVQ